MPFTLQSSAFAQGADIPRTYTAVGDDRSPPLRWSGAPEQTKTFALIMHDPDAPSGDFTHWVLFNMPAARGELPEDTPHRGDLSDGTVQGKNDFQREGYGGPKPPPGKPHRYQFELYALDDFLMPKAGADRKEVERAMQGHVLAKAELMGRFGM
jgi:Raf kinase inhibitor-like YbhB/YbcL family protein